MCKNNDTQPNQKGHITRSTSKRQCSFVVYSLDMFKVEAQLAAIWDTAATDGAILPVAVPENAHWLSRTDTVIYYMCDVSAEVQRDAELKRVHWS